MLSRIRAASSAARDRGALLSFDTEYELVSHICHPVIGSFAKREVQFIVRVVKNLARKDAAKDLRPDPVAPAKKKRSDDFNPFLPYEKAMYVQHIPPSHVLLLNKYNVMDDHVLIVTEKFEDQSSLLNPADFSAMWRCLSDIDGLAFYNSGKLAGASQRHKHLQVVPAHFVQDQAPEGTPLDRIISPIEKIDGIYSSPYLPFVHGVIRLDDLATMPAEEVGQKIMQLYLRLLKVVADEVNMMQQAELVSKTRQEENIPEVTIQPFAYNLLATRGWLLIVPRRNECYEGDFIGQISVNALAFVGCMLVRDSNQLDVVRKSPMKVLEYTGYPRLLDSHVES